MAKKYPWVGVYDNSKFNNTKFIISFTKHKTGTLIGIGKIGHIPKEHNYWKIGEFSDNWGEQHYKPYQTKPLIGGVLC